MCNKGVVFVGWCVLGIVLKGLVVGWKGDIWMLVRVGRKGLWVG